METSAVRGRLQLRLEDVSGKVQHQLGEEEVGDQNDHGSSYHCLRGRSPHSLRSALHLQSLITSNRRYDKAEDERFGQSLHQIGKLQNVNRPRPEGDRTQSKREKGDQVSAD